MEIEIRVQETPLDVAEELTPSYTGNAAVGGVVSFVGLMRDFNEGDQVSEMTLEHYPGMTEKALRAIVDEAAARWELIRVRVFHRVGRIRPQDPIVIVAVASAHRGEAFRACEFIIDYLKTKAPFWKREQTADGRTRWVEARASDDAAADSWQATGPLPTKRRATP
ncbi:MAG: molybdopterin synthase catalytic subunit MoaE [Sedimenticolaceae bacterium]